MFGKKNSNVFNRFMGFLKKGAPDFVNFPYLKKSKNPFKTHTHTTSHTTQYTTSCLCCYSEQHKSGLRGRQSVKQAQTLYLKGTFLCSQCPFPSTQSEASFYETGLSHWIVALLSCWWGVRGRNAHTHRKPCILQSPDYVLRSNRQSPAPARYKSCFPFQLRH